MGVPTDATAKGKFFSSGGMLHVKRTLRALERNSLGSHWALGQLLLGNVGDSLEVIVTRITEVSCPETEEDGHGAAVATLVLQVVRAVLGTHLGLKMENVNQEYNIQTLNL